MKKLFACIALALSISACATVFAAENYYVDYNYDDTNSVTNPAAADYKTVLITKDGAGVTSDSIVYVNQSESGFDSLTKFLLKENPAPGYYTATFGTDNAGIASTSYSFVIGNGVKIQTSDQMAFIEEDEESDYTYTDADNNTTYKRAYQLTTSLGKYQSYKSVKLVYNNSNAESEDDDFTVMGAYPKNMLFEESTLSGAGDIFLLVQFHGMTKDEYDNADTWNVFFSEDDALPVENGATEQ